MTTILIVDDEEPVRSILALLLKDAGYHALEAVNGAEAIAMVDTDHPDLIISDVMMPLLNGAELCRRLKGREATRHIPIILMSAAGKRMAEGSGSDGFIPKPFDIWDVEEMVERLLKQRQVSRAPSDDSLVL